MNGSNVKPPDPTIMLNLKVRQAALSDLEVLAPLFDGYRQFYGQRSDLPGAKAFLRARFDNRESVVFLAEAETDPVGFTQLYPSFSSVSIARTFVLNDLFVTASHRRSGVGAALLSVAIEYARTHEALRISLTTDIQNIAAQATYEATGWKRDRDYFVYHFSLRRPSGGGRA